MKQCLYNTRSDNVVGYCKFHKCYITAKQLRCKDCLNKQCIHLEKNSSHQFWKQREVIKAKRKSKKIAIDEYINNLKNGGNKNE